MHCRLRARDLMDIAGRRREVRKITKTCSFLLGCSYSCCSWKAGRLLEPLSPRLQVQGHAAMLWRFWSTSCTLRSAGRAGHPPARGIGKEEHGHAVRSGGWCCSVLGTTQCRAHLPHCNSSHTAHIAENILLPTAASLQGPKKAA